MLIDFETMFVRCSRNAELRLLLVNEPDSAVAPALRLFLGRTRGGNIWRFRADLPENLIQELDSLCRDEPTVITDFKEPLKRNVMPLY